MGETVRTWDAGDPDDNNWGSPQNWSGDDVPDTADEVASFTSSATGANSITVDDSFTFGGIRLSSGINVRFISDDPANELTLAEDTGADPAGILEIPNGSSLKLDDDVVVVLASPVIHEIGGTLSLEDPSSPGDEPIVVIEADVTFGPYDPLGTPAYGYVSGVDPNALIQIVEPGSGDNTLTSLITIEGMMQIVPVNGTGTATFYNDGLVHANSDAGALTLADNLLLADDDDNVVRWKVTSGASTLLFENGASLESDFDVLGCGVLMFFESVTTTGSFAFTQGFVDVDTNPAVCFTYGSGPTSICNNTENCP
jgi:hypothetical protein